MKRPREILLPEGLYEVTAKSFWGMGLTARFQGIPIMNVSYSWKGGGKLARQDRPDRDLTYKMVSFWKMRYKVTDVKGMERMIIRAKYSWRHTDPDQTIESISDPPLEPLEILILVHAINIGLRRSAGAAVS